MLRQKIPSADTSFGQHNRRRIKTSLWDHNLLYNIMQEMYPTKNIILNCKISFRFQKKKIAKSKSKEKVFTIQSVGGESDNLWMIKSFPVHHNSSCRFTQRGKNRPCFISPHEGLILLYRIPLVRRLSQCGINRPCFIEFP